MDHKASYAHHIAQAIRHKKAMSKGGEVKPEEDDMSLALAEDDFLEADADAPPVDEKAKRKERIKAILAK